ncbi:MAG: tetratricopeptide repeat protein [Phycisphaerales bacterium]
MSHPRPRIGSPARLALIALLAGAAAPLCAQPPAPAPAAPPTAAPTLQRIDAKAMDGVLARWITRIALVDLKISLRPGAAEYTCAATLLDDARRFAPADTDILRLLIEARLQLGQADRAQELLRELRALDPTDRVVELNLLSAAIASKQTAEERLAVYDTLLGPRGNAIDPTVRSRLALDSALLLREKGDAPGFAARLRSAITLDPTNKDAAALFVSLVNARTDDERQRFTALVILLLTDPADPEVFLAMARELASSGASRGAIRFFDNTLALTERTDNQRPPIIVAERLAEVWKTEGPRAVHTFLAQEVLPARKDAEVQIARAKAANVPTDRMMPPEQIRLAHDLERLWAISAAADGNEAAVTAGLDELDKSIELYEQRINSPSRPEGLDEEGLKRSLLRRQADLLWMRLVTGQQLEAAGRQIAALRINTLLSNEALSRLEGWYELRSGQVTEGEDRLRRLAEAGDELAAVGLAAAAEIKGDRSGAAAQYAVLAQRLGGTLAGSWSFSKAAALSGAKAPETPLARAMEDAAAGVPLWIDQMARDPRAFTALAVKPSKEIYAPLEKAEVDVTVRNITPVALGVGNERTVSSRMLLSTDTVAGTRDQRVAPPEVVSLDRRFAIPRSETANFRFWPEQSLAAWMAEMSAGSHSRVRYRALQGFRLATGIAPEAGPLSQSAESTIVMRQRVASPGETAPEIAATIGRAAGDELPYVLLGVKHRLYRDESETDILTPEARTIIATALIDRYTKAETAERIVLLLCLPSGRFLKGLLEFDSAITRLKETDPFALRLKVLTRAVDKDDPLIAEGEASADPATRAVATMMRQRLIDNPRTFSRLPSSGRFSVTGQ